MNIFKKTFNLNFLKRVELRVMKQLKEAIPQQSKLHTREWLGLTSWTLAVLLGAVILKYISHDSESILMHVLSGIGSLALVFDIPLMIASLGYNIHHQYLLMTIKKNISYNNYYYNKFLDAFDVYSNTYLTRHEIDELLSMSLNQKQVEFLQNSIIKNSTFSLADLENLSEILTEEEAIEKQKNKEQQKLNNFLIAHQLENHSSPYMILEQKEGNTLEKEKEQILSSRL